ncbi:MAG: tyrosine-protein phosphatase [bacterium]|nr:tyrosine-protein phosphatase [bacterium]
MSRLAMLGVGMCGLVLTAQARPQVATPAKDEVVSLVKLEQKAFLDRTRAGRRAWLADPKELAQSEKAGCVPAKVLLSWTGAKGRVDVVVRRSGNGPIVFATNAVNLARVEIDNLEIAQTYSWTVQDDEGTAESCFRTEDYAPRFIRVPRIKNLRDLGGRIGFEGRRVRQGLVYRSVGLNENARRVYLSTQQIEDAAANGTLEDLLAKTTDLALKPTDVQKQAAKIQAYIKKEAHVPVRYGERYLLPDKLVPGAARLTAETRAYMTKVLGIKTDLDLRSPAEVFGMKESPLGPGVRWAHIPFSAYGGMGTADGKGPFKKAFKIFLDKANYPIDFHCIMGADRTGSLAFILNGLLGVPEEELYKDWEATAFMARPRGFGHKERLDGLIRVFNAYPGETINARIEAYVLEQGFTTGDIAKFRSIMLE